MKHSSQSVSLHSQSECGVFLPFYVAQQRNGKLLLLLTPALRKYLPWAELKYANEERLEVVEMSTERLLKST